MCATDCRLTRGESADKSRRIESPRRFRYAPQVGFRYRRRRPVGDRFDVVFPLSGAMAPHPFGSGHGAFANAGAAHLIALPRQIDAGLDQAAILRYLLADERAAA